MMRLFPPGLSTTVALALSALAFAGVSRGQAADTPSPSGKMDLFLLVGQSNMAGRGKLADLTPEERAPDPAVWALDREGRWQPASDPLHWDKTSAGVGPGKFFGRLVAERNPGRAIGLIPAACGGSAIGAWVPGHYYKGTDSHPWDDALARAKMAMKSGSLRAILWHQGEGDSNAESAPRYEQRLTDLIARFRGELDAPNLPFIIGQLGDFESEGAPWSESRAAVDRAHRAVAAKIPHVYFVSAKGLGSKGDKLHFSTASQRVLAKGYAEAFFKSQIPNGEAAVEISGKPGK